MQVQRLQGALAYPLALVSSIICPYRTLVEIPSNHPFRFPHLHIYKKAWRRPKMRLRKENLLWNALLGTSVYLLDSLRNRLSEGVDDLSDRARDTYDTTSRRVSRAADVIRGEDHSTLGTAGALLLGVGVGVGLGLLLAPASGEETRGNISNKVHEFGDRVREKVQEQKRESSGTYGT